MKLTYLALFAVLFTVFGFTAHADPEEDRLSMIEHYKKILPDIKVDDYVLGALSMNPQAKVQYDEMMEFPPFIADVRQGGVVWERRFKNNKRLASCFNNGGINAAINYPYFDDQAGRVITFENAINNCLKANDEKEIPYGSKEMTFLTSYAKSLSDNARVKIKINTPAARAAYEDGKRLYYERRGQLNFSCASCHVSYAGKYLRSEQLSMMIGQATHWPEFRAGTEPVSLQMRFVQCQKNTKAKPYEINSVEYNNLEYFMTYMSNGLKMLTPVFRK